MLNRNDNVTQETNISNMTCLHVEAYDVFGVFVMQQVSATYCEKDETKKL